MSIHLSPKYGVNPAIPTCFWCGKDKNMIVLPGYLPGDKEAPNHAVWDYEPCDKCKKHMETSIILLGINDKDCNNKVKNPYRTGEFLVVSEDFAKDALNIDVSKNRWAYIPHTMAKDLVEQFQKMQSEG